MKTTKNPQWIDISTPLRSGMVHWPGDPVIQIKRVKSIDKGQDCNVSHISMGVHSATHMDAPLHFLQKGKGIESMPISAVIGTARVIGIKDEESIKPHELKKHRIRRGERLLFKTVNSARYREQKRFIKKFVFISKEAAHYLAEIGVQTVGIDYLSVGGFYKDGKETHDHLLTGGVWIIEGLNLSGVEPGRYELFCLPLKIVNADGAPARAVLRARS